MVSARLDPNPLLTPAEAGAMLGVSPRTVIRWSEGGRLRSLYTEAGDRVFLGDDLLALFPDVTTRSGSARSPADPPPAGETSGTSSAESNASAAVVAEAVVIAAEADALLAQEAIDVAAAEVLAAAGRAAEAADRAREARSFAAALAAKSVARAAGKAAEAERTRADSAADRVRVAASDAARTLRPVDTASAASVAAERMASVVLSAARACADDVARSAALTAQTVADAAAQVVRMDSVLDEAVELEVTAAAKLAQETATLTALRVAAVTQARATVTARIAREADEAAKVRMPHAVPVTDYWSATTTLAPDPSSPAIARAFVHVHLARHDMPHLAEDIKLVASELATNAVTHAQTPFSVSLEASGGLVTLAVRDRAAALPPVPANMAMGDHSDVHGRGMGIVQLLSDESGVTRGVDGSKSVWASFDTGGS